MTDGQQKAFLELNILVDEQEHIMSVISAILCIGNIDFAEDGSLTNQDRKLFLFSHPCAQGRSAARSVG